MGARVCKRSVTHLFFADDSIVFGEATNKGGRVIKEILDIYESASRQKVNFEKSVIFFSSNTDDQMCDSLTCHLGVRRAYNIEKYLGLPTLVGRRKKEAFGQLCDRMRCRVKAWSNRFLSQRGKSVFIKAILQALPTYSMSFFLLPKTLCHELEQIMSRFWWQKGVDCRGMHWCRWSDLSFSKDAGGMGFRDLCKFNIALLAKQG